MKNDVFYVSAKCSDDSDCPFGGVCYNPGGYGANCGM